MPAATLGEKVDAAVGAAGVLLQVLCCALRYPFQRAAAAVQPTLARELRRQLLRRALDRFSVAQIQWALPRTGAVYAAWVARRGGGAAPHSEALGGDGAALHWVGRRDATKVILHFHGGGYVMPMAPAHLEFVSYLRREATRRTGVEVKAAFLEYTLAPAHTYPTQFGQAARALQHILDSGIAPGDIVLSGDSAGGQLALQVLAHLLHPHPALARVAAAGPLAGVLLLSPWAVFASTAPSFVHSTADMLSPGVLRRWARAFTAGTALAGGAGEADGFWGEPLKAPAGWWRGAAARGARAVFVAYGAAEAFRDDNAALVETLRAGAGAGAVRSVEEPRGLHIGPVLDAQAGRAPGDVAQAIAGWVAERLAG